MIADGIAVALVYLSRGARRGDSSNAAGFSPQNKAGFRTTPRRLSEIMHMKQGSWRPRPTPAFIFPERE
jgi:hypothetical protein